MGNFLSQFNDLVNRDADSKVPDVQLDFEGMNDSKKKAKFSALCVIVCLPLLCEHEGRSKPEEISIFINEQGKKMKPTTMPCCFVHFFFFFCPFLLSHFILCIKLGPTFSFVHGCINFLCIELNFFYIYIDRFVDDRGGARVLLKCFAHAGTNGGSARDAQDVRGLWRIYPSGKFHTTA
jgi:hypothetical protein